MSISCDIAFSFEGVEEMEAYQPEEAVPKGICIASITMSPSHSQYPCMHMRFFPPMSVHLTVLCQLDRITRTQLQELIETCVHKFLRAKIEPGTSLVSSCMPIRQ